MPVIKKIKPYQRWIAYSLALLALLFIVFIIVADRFVVPVLKKQLHTLIVQGSDSLYNYSVGNLNASLFGGDVEIENLQIHVDSVRYNQLKANNSLPPFTMGLNMVKGQVKGVAIFSLLFNKKIFINKIITQDANVHLFHHLVKVKPQARIEVPLWKAIQPTIKSVSIQTVNLDGVKLVYQNADTTTSIKLQFDTCHAVFNNILIDSAATVDTTRMAFSKDVSFRFSQLQYRTPDSVSKMRAEGITYSSKTGLVEIKNFKVQPTREDKKDFYAFVKKQDEMQVFGFQKASLSNFSLSQFLNKNVIAADSLIIQKPTIDIYLDKTAQQGFKNKIGNYPHQQLLGAAVTIIIKGVALQNANISYTEKAANTGLEGTVALSRINMVARNVTNDALAISKNNKCVVTASGTILGKSQITASFTFYLDSTNGKYDARGTITNVNASQLNKLAVPLANMQLQSFNINQLQFALTGNDLNASGRIKMTYDNLFLIIRKKDKETGVNSTNQFLTGLINKYTLQSSNPAPGGAERFANEKQLRISSQGFFGLVWRTIFGGMQSIMLNKGGIE